jgi:hypothetical protein
MAQAGTVTVSGGGNMTPAKRLIMMGFKPENMLVYNPTTWAEWTKTAGVVGDATGLEFSELVGSYRKASLTGAFKPNTAYGLLFNVVSSDVTCIFFVSRTGTAFNVRALDTLTGHQSHIITTKSVIDSNRFMIELGEGTTSNNTIKIENIRLFELPTGSEIEADFANLTADQLNAKYPF